MRNLYPEQGLHCYEATNSTLCSLIFSSTPRCVPLCPENRLNPVCEDWIHTSLKVLQIGIPTTISMAFVCKFIIIIVMLEKEMRTVLNVYLGAHTISDILYLICAAVLQFITWTNVNGEFSELASYFYFFSEAFWLSSLWTFIFALIERCAKFSNSRLSCTKSGVWRSCFVVILTYVICFASSSPRMWIYLDTIKGIPISFKQDAPKNFCKTYDWFLTTFSILIPYLLYLILSITLITSIQKKRQFNEYQPADEINDNWERNITRNVRLDTMLICVAILTLILNGSFSYSHLWLHHISPDLNAKAIIVSHILHFVVFINMILEFFLYLGLYETFQNACLSFCCNCSKESSHKIKGVKKKKKNEETDGIPLNVPVAEPEEDES